MMSRSQKETLATRSRSSSLMMARTLVSHSFPATVRHIANSRLVDVIVLAAMGEEAAIDAKEAPKG